MPAVGVSTPKAFARYDEIGSSVHPDGEAAEQAVRAGNLDALAAQMKNALEESSESRHNEPIRRILDENGALASLMTGSGAAVFGVFRTEQQAQAAAQALRGQYRQVYVQRPCPGGARVIKKSF